MKIISNSFYAVGDYKSPLIIILIQQVINIILNMMLVKTCGLNGIAYATSISTIFGGLMISYSYHRKFGKYNVSKGLISVIKIVIGSLGMIVLAINCLNSMTNFFGEIQSLVFTIVVSGIGYLIFISLVKID